MSTLKKSLIAAALVFSLFAAPAKEAKAGGFTYYTYIFAIEGFTYTYNGYSQKATGYGYYAYLYAYYAYLYAQVAYQYNATSYNKTTKDFALISYQTNAYAYDATANMNYFYGAAFEYNTSSLAELSYTYEK